MIDLTTIHGIPIKYVGYDNTKNWLADFPDKNWAAIIVADILNRNYFDEIIRKLIDRNVIWICGVGKQQDLIHNMADEEILIREFEKGYLPSHDIMTIGVENFMDGLFSGIFLPIQSEDQIQKIIIVDVEKSNENKISLAIGKLKKEYI